MGAIVVAGWLLVGRRWSGVDAWEQIWLRRAFQTQAACEDHRRARATIAATWGWVETRCVTHQEFAHHYPKSESGDFGFDLVPELDRATRQRLRELGYSD